MQTSLFLQERGCASSSELHQPLRLEAVSNGRALFSTVHTACHRNLRPEKTEMQGSWTVSAAPRQQTEVIGADIIDSAGEAKGPMLPAARWTSNRRDGNYVSRDLGQRLGRRAKDPDTKFPSLLP